MAKRQADAGDNGQVRATVSRREREKAHRRDRILSAAREVFFEQGFHRATVDDVAEQAEVGKGTVYLYFDTKETILAHLLLEGLQLLVDELEAAFAPSDHLSAPDRVHRLAAAYLKFYQNQPAYFHWISAFDRGRFRESLSPDLYNQVLTRSLRGLEWLVRAVDQGRADGVFDVRDTREAAGMLWAGLNGVLVLLDHPLRRDIVQSDLEALYGAMMETLLRGMNKEQ